MTINRAPIFLSMVLALAGAVSARGQTPNRFAYFDVDFNERGDASIDLSLNFDAHSIVPALADGMGKALGCQL
jgi:hypothetical protein